MRYSEKEFLVIAIPLQYLNLNFTITKIMVESKITNPVMRESLKTRLKLLKDENRLLAIKVKSIQNKRKEINEELKQISELLKK